MLEKMSLMMQSGCIDTPRYDSPTQNILTKILNAHGIVHIPTYYKKEKIPSPRQQETRLVLSKKDYIRYFESMEQLALQKKTNTQKARFRIEALPYYKPRKVASEFIESKLSKVLKKEHETYFDQLSSLLLNDPKVLERNLDPSPLSLFEREGLLSLIHDICDSTLSNTTNKSVVNFIETELKKYIKEEHTEYTERIISTFLENENIVNSNLDYSNLNYFQKKGVTALFLQTYGGTVSHHEKKLFKDLMSDKAVKFYAQLKNSSVSIGCFINTVQSELRSIKDKESPLYKAASLSYATLHKVIKNAVPNLVASKGRDPKQNKDKVSFFLRKEILNT